MRLCEFCVGAFSGLDRTGLDCFHISTSFGLELRCTVKYMWHRLSALLSLLYVVCLAATPTSFFPQLPFSTTCEQPRSVAAINPDGSRSIYIVFARNTSAEDSTSNDTCAWDIRCEEFSADGDVFLSSVFYVNSYNFTTAEYRFTVLNTVWSLVTYNASARIAGEGTLTRAPSSQQTFGSSQEIVSVTSRIALRDSVGTAPHYAGFTVASLYCTSARPIRDRCAERNDTLIGRVLMQRKAERLEREDLIGEELAAFPLSCACTSTSGTMLPENISVSLPPSVNISNTSSSTPINITILVFDDKTVPESQFEIVEATAMPPSAPGISISRLGRHTAMILLLQDTGNDPRVRLRITRNACPFYDYQTTLHIRHFRRQPTATSTEPSATATATSVAVGVTTTVAVLAGSSAAASKSASVATVRRLLVCQSSDEPTNSLLGVGQGRPERYYMRGAVIVNTGFVALQFACIATVIVVVAATNRKLPFAPAVMLLAELLHVPSIFFPVAAGILQPTAGAAMTLVVFREPGDVAIGVVWLATAGAFYAYVFWSVMWKFDCEVSDKPKPLVRPMWLDEHGGAWRTAHLLFAPRFHWVAKTRKSWKRRHLFFFFQGNMRWFVLFNEITAAALLGVVAGVSVDDQTLCTAQIVLLLVVGAAQIAAAVYLRPSLTLFDEAFLHGSNVVSFLICGLMLLDLTYVDSSSGGRSLSTLIEYLLLLLTLLAFAKAAVDFAGVLIASRDTMKKIKEMYATNGTLILNGEYDKADLVVHGAADDEAVEFSEAVDSYSLRAPLNQDVVPPAPTALNVRESDSSVELDVISPSRSPPKSPRGSESFHEETVDLKETELSPLSFLVGYGVSKAGQGHDLTAFYR